MTKTWRELTHTQWLSRAASTHPLAGSPSPPAHREAHGLAPLHCLSGDWPALSGLKAPEGPVPATPPTPSGSLAAHLCASSLGPTSTCVTGARLLAHEDPADECGLPISFVVPEPGEPDPHLTQNFPPITGSLDTLSPDNTHTTQQSNVTSFRKPS